MLGRACDSAMQGPSSGGRRSSRGVKAASAAECEVLPRASLESSLLLGDSEGGSLASSGLGMLALDLEAEVVAETSVLADLLHALEIFSESGVNHVGDQLAPGAVSDASLSVQKPLWNAVFDGLGEDVTNSVHFVFSQLTGSAAGVNLGNFAAEDAEATAHTLNSTEGERGLLLSIHVCVLHSENVLEVVSFLQDKCRLKFVSKQESASPLSPVLTIILGCIK